MISDKEELKKLIPFYLNKTLSQDEKRSVEEALAKDPEIEEELVEYSRIKEVIETEPLPEPPGYLYEKIRGRIEEDKSFFQKLRDLLESLYNSRTISWGLVAAQAALILFLFFRPVSPTYKTLTTSPSHEGVYINVVFKEDTLEKDMRALLNKVGGVIVEGPTEEGLYVIRLTHVREMGRVLKMFKNSGKVKFVARAYR